MHTHLNDGDDTAACGKEFDSEQHKHACLFFSLVHVTCPRCRAVAVSIETGGDRQDLRAGYDSCDPDYVLNSAPRSTSEAGADSAAVAVNSGGATLPQVLEHDRYKVTIREDRMSGWFELDGEAIGGLIFDTLTSKEPGAIELTDYDGVFALPSWVIRMLREMGVHVDMTFCKE